MERNEIPLNVVITSPSDPEVRAGGDLQLSMLTETKLRAIAVEAGYNGKSDRVIAVMVAVSGERAELSEGDRQGVLHLLHELFHSLLALPEVGDGQAE
jgi:hypothetical protein